MSPPTPPPLPAFLQLKQGAGAGAGARGRRQVQVLLPRDTGETSTDDQLVPPAASTVPPDPVPRALLPPSNAGAGRRGVRPPAASSLTFTSQVVSIMSAVVSLSGN